MDMSVLVLWKAASILALIFLALLGTLFARSYRIWDESPVRIDRLLSASYTVISAAASCALAWNVFCDVAVSWPFFFAMLALLTIGTTSFVAIVHVVVADPER